VGLLAGVLAVAAVGGAAVGGWGPYQVSAGDSLWSLAAGHHTTIGQIMTMNGLTGADLRAGDILYLPGSRSGTAGRVDPPGGYVVRPGDSLSALAARAGVSVAQLAARNAMSPDDVLPVGQLLLLAPGPLPSPTDGDATPEPLAAPLGPAVAPAAGPAAGGGDADPEAVGSGAAGIVGPTVPARPTDSAANVREIQQMIRSQAQAQGVDPALALAVASAESDFDPAAVSRTGAVGVMQLMPRTAAWLGKRLGRSLDRANLADNIAGGVAFLRYLLAATPGDPHTAIGAYYQGLDSVRRDGFFPDTTAYMEKVVMRQAQFAHVAAIVN
jgi:soluble lytic murein transglycosylase-like protein